MGPNLSRPGTAKTIHWTLSMRSLTILRGSAGIAPTFAFLLKEGIGDTLTLDQTTLLEVEFSTGTGLRA